VQIKMLERHNAEAALLGGGGGVSGEVSAM